MEDLRKNTELIELAKSVCKNAHVPYSNFPVGAAVLYESGNVYTGCNVENASYTVGICAERNAISTAVASGEDTPIYAVAIYSPVQDKCLPCGACLQWFSEFKHKYGNKDIKVILEDKDKGIITYTLSELLPYDFKFEK